MSKKSKSLFHRLSYQIHKTITGLKKRTITHIRVGVLAQHSRVFTYPGSISFSRMRFDDNPSVDCLGASSKFCYCMGQGGWSNNMCNVLFYIINTIALRIVLKGCVECIRILSVLDTGGGYLSTFSLQWMSRKLTCLTKQIKKTHFI